MKNASGWTVTFFKNSQFDCEALIETVGKPDIAVMATLYRNEVEVGQFVIPDMVPGSTSVEQAEQFFKSNALTMEVKPAPSVEPYSDYTE